MSRLTYWAGWLAVVACMVGGLSVVLATGNASRTLGAEARVLTSPAGVLALGIAIGLLLSLVISWAGLAGPQATSPSLNWRRLGWRLGCALALAMFAVIDSALRAGVLSAERAILGLVLAMLTAVTGALTLVMLADGQPVEFETHWGGVGGGMGGWRISTPAVLLTLTLLFAGGAVAILTPHDQAAIGRQSAGSGPAVSGGGGRGRT